MGRSGSKPGAGGAHGANARRHTASGRAAQRALRASGGNRGLWIGSVVVVVVAVAVMLGIVLSGHQNGQRNAAVTTVPTQPIRTATGRTTPPPWQAPTDASGAVAKAGLPMLNSEGVVEHIHAHLDVLVDGKPVAVPAGIGIDEQAGTISPLHDHDTSGVIHVESPAKVPFSLGQFFTEWQVTLSSTQLGGLKAGNGNTLRAYVNGKPDAGDPAAVTINAHDEITLVYGPAGAQPKVPNNYAFPQGE